MDGENYLNSTMIIVECYLRINTNQGQTNNEVSPNMIFKNCAPFAKCKQNKQYASR